MQLCTTTYFLNQQPITIHDSICTNGSTKALVPVAATTSDHRIPAIERPNKDTECSA